MSVISMMMSMEHQWNNTEGGKSSTPRKTHPSATLSTTNPTWTGWKLDLGIHDDRPTTNYLSHSAAQLSSTMAKYILLTISVPTSQKTASKLQKPIT